MSEFQYYEFQAVDRALTEQEISELRKCSSRASITPTRFVNHYSYGNFNGDEKKWIERYFDAFLYVANWGARQLVFRFPKQAVDSTLIKQYCANECFRCRTTQTHVIIEFAIEESENTEWMKEDDESLGRLIVLRDEVLLNDYRLLYLGWLLCVQNGELDTKTLEPPVPAGLGDLSPALKLFVRFFELDQKLVQIASLNSPDDEVILGTDDIEPCVAGLSNGEKFNWLCRLALEYNRNLQAEFRRFLLPDSGVELFSDGARRRIGDIIKEN